MCIGVANKWKYDPKKQGRKLEETEKKLVSERTEVAVVKEEKKSGKIKYEEALPHLAFKL
jgi:hypothetical protein